MTAKEYLSQAFHLSKLIDSELEQIMSLRALATKATAVLSKTNVQNTKNDQKLEDVIIRMLEYEDMLRKDMARLIVLKKEITEVIKRVDNDEYRILLELRYLCSKRWEEIAVQMGYSLEHTYHLHRDALKKVRVPTT